MPIAHRETNILCWSSLCYMGVVTSPRLGVHRKITSSHMNQALPSPTFTSVKGSHHSLCSTRVLLTSLWTSAATWCQLSLICAETSSELVTAWATVLYNQRKADQCVDILLRLLIENRLDNRGYSHTLWRRESQGTE